MRRDPTSERSDIYEFKMALFDNGDPEELVLLMQNFKMMLKASGILDTSANLQYLCTLLHCEALCQFDIFCAQVGSMYKTHLSHIILG